MSYQPQQPLPVTVRCEACPRVWEQSEPWPEGTLLTCQCGRLALKN